MKRSTAIMLVLFLTHCMAFSQRTSVSVRENLFPGFGMGSLHQGDTLSARRYEIVDGVGFSLIGLGTIGMAATAVERDLLKAMVGETTKADYYVCGGMVVAGVATLVTSRILAVNRARKYRVAPVAYEDGGGISLKVCF
ncbi:MAG: P13 family porin [Bacteroidaceae bacterium]|nr:P13 family porin [Bacteroidaceae bacterium]